MSNNKTFTIKISGTQSDIDNFSDTLPVESVCRMSGSFPHRNDVQVHKYIKLYSKYFEQVHQKPAKIMEVAE
ncbi:hypothetical protein DMA11_10210 [Marinilabiliaceae bacterium JC017]|nr:hypothetical protein DMA11_10210 [Marinilabiliaceae bacterium JC017]